MAKSRVRILPNGDRYSYELADRSALVGIFLTPNDAAVAARLAGYEVVFVSDRPPLDVGSRRIV